MDKRKVATHTEQVWNDRWPEAMKKSVNILYSGGGSGSGGVSPLGGGWSINGEGNWLDG